MRPGLPALESAFARVRADEGTLWLLDEEQAHLVPAWNSGPDAASFVGRFRQPLSRGLVSLVCIGGQPLCENDVSRNTRQDASLDRQLGKLTCAMIAVPLRVRGEIRGVVSCVKLKARDAAGPDPAGFTAEDLQTVSGAAEAAGDAMGAAS